MDNFVHLHLHTHFSNGVTIPEVVNFPTQYISRVAELGGKSICFTEHGSVLSWVAKKKAANQMGLKYIHGVEFYVTETLEEKIRDNYHLIAIAKNYDGVKEINKLVSKSFSGRGQENTNNFYYYPRISVEDVFNTSDNIIILTACVASPLWQFYRSKHTVMFNRFVEFIKNNNHRVWLEVQPHKAGDQVAYNKLLRDLSVETGAKLVGTTDVHALTKADDEVRSILMKSKGFNKGDEDGDDYDCVFKTRSEMEKAFLDQGVFSIDEITDLLDETVVIADKIEDFDFDYSYKYPKIFENSESRFKDLVAKGVVKRGINKLPKEQQLIYRQRMIDEMTTFYNSETIDYMLLIDYVISSANDNNIFTGPGRGSVTGSLISFLLGTTDVDPIKENLSFERFMNPDRISLADIDTDVSGVGNYSDRDWIADFLINNEKFNCSAIVTYNTLGLKGAIKDVGRAMGYDPQEMNFLTKQIEEEIPHHIKVKYPELTKNAELLTGVITSIGRHAAGFVVTTRDIEEELGFVSVSNSDYMISSVSMKEIDMLNYVKLDILGLDNLALINKTCELAGIDRATPNSTFIDFNDQNVVDDLTKSTIGIFQFEGIRAQKLVKEMFSPESQERIRKSGVDTAPVAQLALLSAAMRPGAASIVDDVVRGVVYDNGQKELNELLSDTLGYLIYQESQIEFLVKMCGRTKAQADLIRRAIGKKNPETLKIEIPKIKKEFIDTMTTKYGDTEEHAESIADRFMQIFQDAANYSFSKNHAIPYSYIGYLSAWLRYYYPLEFLTSAFQIFGDDKDKISRLTDYAHSKGIMIKPAKFGFAKGHYFFDKESNTIFEGTGVIKGMNAQVGDMLYDLEEKDFDTFTDFLMYIRDDFCIYSEVDNKVFEKRILSWLDFKTLNETDVKEIDKKIKAIAKEQNIDSLLVTNSHKIDRAKLLSLVRLKYFEKFGGNKKLEQVLLKFFDEYKPTLKTYATKWKKYTAISEFERSLEDEDNALRTQLTYEMDYLGRCRTTKKINVSEGELYFVANILTIAKNSVQLQLYSPITGVIEQARVSISKWRNVKLAEKDIVKVHSMTRKAKVTKINDKWVDHPTETNLWLDNYTVVHIN
ncbi:TPA: PHP domain-containing protein [Streptococcus suis]